MKSFYRDDEISRPMPGKKDFLSVREGGEKVHLQKRLLLCNLKEVYHPIPGCEGWLFYICRSSPKGMCDSWQ